MVFTGTALFAASLTLLLTASADQANDSEPSDAATSEAHTVPARVVHAPVLSALDLEEGEQFTAMAVGPMTGGVIYVGTSGGRIFSSDSRGLTWSVRDLSVPELNLVAPKRGARFYNGAPSRALGPLGLSRLTTGSSHGWFGSAGLLPPGNANAVPLDLDEDSGAWMYSFDCLGGSCYPQKVPFVDYIGLRELGHSILRPSNIDPSFKLRGTARQITALAVVPGDESIAIAGTSLGVFRTTNGGRTWRRILLGLKAGASAEHCLTVRMEQREVPASKRADGEPSGNQRTSTSPITRAYLETKEGYFTGLVVDGVFEVTQAPPSLAAISRLVDDGFEIRKKWGATWKRIDSKALGRQAATVVFRHESDKRRHFVAAQTEVWESQDTGSGWRMVAETDAPVKAFANPSDRDDDLWVLTGSEVILMAAADTSKFQAISARTIASRRAAVAHEPTLAESLREALAFLGHDIEAIRNSTNNVTISGLLPMVHLAVGYHEVHAGGVVDGPSNLSDLNLTDPKPTTSAPPILERRLNFEVPYFTATLQWDLDAVTNVTGQVATKIAMRKASDNASRIAMRIRLLYSQRQKILAQATASPRMDIYTQELLRLRLQRFTAKLNGLTNGLWAKSFNHLDELF